MSSIRNIESTARPLRIAYLIDLNSCQHEQIDAIIAECHSRWGGRRSLIVPTNENEGIHTDYADWLRVFDPDIIYSYLNLTEEVVASIHETYCPLYLTKHHIHRGRDESDPLSSRDFSPELPIEGLLSVSVFPLLATRRGLEDFSGCKVMDCSYRAETPRYISDNFGLLSHSFGNSMIAENHTELYRALTLIDEESLNDPRTFKSDSRDYVTSSHALVEKLTTRGEKTLSLSMLSDCLSWFLDFDSHEQSDSFNLVIGSTVEDRILFWNFHHHYTNVSTSEIVNLIVTPEDMENPERLEEIANIVKIRSHSRHSGYPVTIRSFSQSEENLAKFSDQIREKLQHARIHAQKLATHQDYVPSTNRRHGSIRFRAGSYWNESISKVTSSYMNDLLNVPVALPIHLKDLYIPPGLKSGAWVLDLAIERQNNLSRYSNIPHIWRFPRRMRIDLVFRRSEHVNQQDIYLRAIRVNRDSLISVPITHSMEQPVFELPNDENAIAGALTPYFEWEPFDRFGDGNQAQCRKKYNAIRISDKGRYFQGFMQCFGSIDAASSILLHKFWYRVFSDLGASKGYISEGDVNKVTKRIDRRLSNDNPGHFLHNNDQKIDFAESCLKIAVNVSRDKKYIRWSKLIKIWEPIWQEFIDQHPHIQENAEQNKHDDFKTVEESTQLLCQKKILFQGQEWKCRNCYHKNWVSIEDICASLVCEVCSNEEPAPVAQDWMFRLNEFLLDAMRQHGTTALVWCLVQLWEKAKSSFYYIPSIKVLESRLDAPPEIWSEIDLITVIDGDLYVCEVKSSPSVSNGELDSFIKVVNCIRPDYAFFAIMDEGENIIQSITQRVGSRLDDGIKLEVLTLRPHHFDDDARLPNGRELSV